MGIKRRLLGSHHTVLERMKRLTGKKRLIKLYNFLSPRRLVEMAYMFALLIFFAGIINALLEGQNFPNAIIIPSFRIQSMMETFLNLLTMIIGTLGIYLMYLGGRRTGRRAPSLYVISGWIVLGISMVIWLFIIGAKVG